MEQNTKVHNCNTFHNLVLHTQFCRTSTLGAFVPWRKINKKIYRICYRTCKQICCDIHKSSALLIKYIITYETLKS